MSYLGRSVDAISNVEKLDNITFNGGTTYALTKSSAAFTPAGANNILISIDGVVQQGNFSVSGSNIVFTFSPTSSNTCDFIMHYGTGLITTPADSSVTEAKIGSNAVTTAKIQNDAVTVDKLNLISTSSVPSLEAKGTSGQTEGYIQLNCAENSHGIKLKSPPHSASQSYTLTFPSTAPAANKILQTDGSGNLSFVDAPSGSYVYLGGINASNHNANTLRLEQVFANDYRRYRVVGKFQGTGNGADIRFRWLKSDNVEEQSSYYNMTDGQKADSSANSTERWNDWNQQYARMFRDTATGSHIHSFEMLLFPNQNENVNYPTAIFHTQTWDHNNGANRQRIITGAIYNEITTSVAGGGMQLQSTSGNFGTVNVSIWGLKDS